MRIVDGQHRLMGYSKLDVLKQKESELPVIVFDNMTKEEEIEMFLKINMEQQKINPNLTLILKSGDLNWPEGYIMCGAIFTSGLLPFA